MLTKFLKRKIIKALKVMIYFVLGVDPEETKVNILDLDSNYFIFCLMIIFDISIDKGDPDPLK